ncbi:MAG: transcription-repair coupling factor [Oscillospiraceae bacterium]|nr:transcription-repair coupling factor [Oscillospiraceae bacterium]
MDSLIRAVCEEPVIEKLISAIDAGACPGVVSGLGGVHYAVAAAAVHTAVSRPMLVICHDEQAVKRMSADLFSLTGREPVSLLSRDFVFANVDGASRAGEQERIAALYAMKEGRAPIVCASVDGVMQRTLPPEVLSDSAFLLDSRKTYDLEELCVRLADAGYTRSEQVEGPGQFALRGGIIDIFSPSYVNPVRCEFFGDDIDSMGFFDVSTQRRVEMTEKAVILPACEALISAGGGPEALADKLSRAHDKLSRRKNTMPEQLSCLMRDIERLRTRRGLPAADKYMELLYPMASAADYLNEDAVVIVSEPGRCAERAKNYAWQLGEDVTGLAEGGTVFPGGGFFEPFESLMERLSDYPLIMMDAFTAADYPVKPKTLLTVTAKQLPSYGGSLETAAGDIAHYTKTGKNTVVLCREKRGAETLLEYLEGQGIKAVLDLKLATLPPAGTCAIALGGLSAGFEYPELKLAVITEGQIISGRGNFRKKAAKNKKKLESFSDLSVGDLVVHEHYGIGRFEGIVKRKIDGVEKDYVRIAYAGTDVLYVPATQLDAVTKYIGAGGEDSAVRLSKMGGADWSRAKTRARGAVKELARSLVALQAERKRTPGFAFSPDSVWQREFEQTFPYAETEDQLRAVEEIKRDMEAPAPMDRLLCGDVGYGKTEVALRAVMKCVLDGKQAAILVPTTVLAQQHYATIVNRFSGYPVKTEVLSRFRTANQLKSALKAAADGSADIIVGTHKLLQRDVKFRDLGLLVVDEEQRFGVAHKERLKEIARNVDVLTLSATPIPRTLNMALSGIRDMSTIEEPPQDRLPVQTYVLEHDWGVIRDAVSRELSRGGQVYYLHNRVETITRTAAKIRELLPEAAVDIAHGKMDEEELGNAMRRLSEGETQILVCTTIIETGIDIPNVNTLIIEDADRLGLAQLHQIRGRVGRSPRRAFAYLTYRPGKVLTETAAKRLSAIREFAEFNSGFKIAMRDLEIRGAGNILGAEQSGHMMSVGYDMYLQLLEDAVLEERGEKPRIKTECSADLTVSAYIPERYIPSAEQRMDIYRRIAHVRSEEDADDMTDELIDRYGEPPREVNALIYIALMRGEAAKAGISEVTQRQGLLRFKLEEFSMEKISALYSREEYKGRLRVDAGSTPAVTLKLRPGKDVTGQAVRFIRDYSAALMQ